MKFSEVVETLAPELERIEEAIRENFRSNVVLIPDVSGYLSRAGGKRVRPMLLLLSAKACGYEGPRAIIHSCVVEYIHTATLLHDDVVDAAEVRRGNPSANAKWGNEASVLVGDFLFAKSFSMMSEDQDGRIMKTMAKACTLLSEGEVLELVNVCNIRMSEEEYLEIISRKTAALIAASGKMGALLGDSPPPVVDAIYQFGSQVGFAFQLVDDALDYMGDEARTGKAVGKDLEDGKVTLPLLRACEQATPSEFEKLNQILLHSNSFGSEDFDVVLELIQKYEGIPYAIDRARGYVEAAKAVLSILPDSVHVDSLRALADYIVERDF